MGFGSNFVQGGRVETLAVFKYLTRLASIEYRTTKDQDLLTVSDAFQQRNMFSVFYVLRVLPQIILQTTTSARRTQHKSFLERVPILEQLTEYEILTIADALVEDSYEDGDVVCTQGEVGDAFYIIKKVVIRVMLPYVYKFTEDREKRRLSSE